MNNSFCPLPFSHLAVRPNGKVYPCCIFDWEHVPDDLDLNHPDVFNHPFMQDIREKMRNNESVPGCNKCYTNEEKTGHSTRMFFLNNAENFNIPTKPIKESKIKYLDLALSNTCNNKCRMCNPELSTSWYADAKALGMPIYKGILNQETVLDGYDLSELTLMKLIGGEPLMEQPKFINVLKRCNRKNLRVLLTTNTTLKPNQELFDLLKECKECHINLSIDAYGELNNFLRKGSKWDNVLENINWFTENFKEDIKVHSVASIYNINHLDKLSNFLKDNFPKIRHEYVLVDGPDWMRPRHLPENAKIEIKKLFELWTKHTAVPFLKILEDELSKTGDFNIFIKNDKKINDIRNENWAYINPELYEMVKTYYE